MRTTTLAATAAALLLAAMVAAAVGSTAAAGMWHVKDTRESLANGVTHLRSVRKWTGSAKPPQDGSVVQKRVSCLSQPGCGNAWRDSKGHYLY